MLRELPAGYSVRYHHEREREPVDADAFGDILPKGGRTEALIFDAEGNQVASGEAICRPDENFQKRLGRIVALGRALQELERKQAAPKRGIGRIVGTRKRRSLEIQAD